jgi:hypothetical protein
MIVEFKKDNFVNVDDITALRWIDREAQSGGIVIMGGERIVVDKREFNVIKKAFEWNYRDSIYNKAMKKKGE